MVLGAKSAVWVEVEVLPAGPPLVTVLGGDLQRCRIIEEWLEDLAIGH